MDVSTLLTNIRNQALIGNSGLASDTVKLVAYLNIAYRKIYDRVTRNYPFIAATTQDVAIVSGSGTFSPSPYYVLSVRDAGNSYAALERSDIETLEEMDNAMSATGAPSYWYVDGMSTVKTYPANSTTLRVRYVPNANTLAEDSAESEIKLPVMHHDCLMYEALKTLAYDERDKITGAEMAILERMAEDAMGRLETYLATLAGQPVIRVEGIL